MRSLAVLAAAALASACQLGARSASQDAGAGQPAPDGGQGALDAGGDTFLAWEGGPDYWKKFSKGPPTDPGFFPIAVFWQSSVRAAAYQAIGVNTFVTYSGDADVTALDQAGLYTFADQTATTWASLLGTGKLAGWIQQDEPDNAQDDGHGGYGPCVDPAVIQGDYTTFKTNDPNRPVYLNTGQGTAWHDYYGRGSACAGKVDMYTAYAKGADFLSFDIYPVNSTDAAVHGKLELVAAGIDTLRAASDNQKPVMAWIESTDMNAAGGDHLPTAAQMRAEVWMTLVHGARGFGYFCHIFKPSFVEGGLLATSSTKAAATAINAEVTSLAPALNEPSVANWGTVASSVGTTPIDVMVKRHGGATWLFAVAMRPDATTGTFQLDRIPATASAEVLGESRTLTVSGGSFQDAFAGYAVHLYKITY